MTEEQHKRFVIFVALYFTLATAFIMVLIFSTIYLLTRDDEPCVWEDCTSIDGSGPQCVNMGDAACLVVPD